MNQILLTSIAFAQQTEATGGLGSQMIQLFPILIVIVIFYFLLIRPQQKERKKTQEFLDNLKAGDKVITTGGLLGTIHSVSDKMIQLKITDNVKVSILRSAIRGLQEDDNERKS